MVLQAGSFFESDATGANETITLQSASNLAVIASAVYGNPPQVVPVAGDRKSFSFTVIHGVNALVVTLASPNPNDEAVKLTQGATVISSPVISRHSSVITIFINGT